MLDSNTPPQDSDNMSTNMDDEQIIANSGYDDLFEFMDNSTTTRRARNIETEYGGIPPRSLNLFMIYSRRLQQNHIYCNL